MSLHERLRTDTLAVCESSSAHIRLMNDRRWPWLILVPIQPSLEELHDLTHSQRDAFIADVNQVSRVVQTCTQCVSVNIAMIGNVVTQLHCHVVARQPGDPNWPNPVWGFEHAEPYANDLPDTLLNAIKKSFG